MGKLLEADCIPQRVGFQRKFILGLILSTINKRRLVGSNCGGRSHHQTLSEQLSSSISCYETQKQRKTAMRSLPAKNMILITSANCSFAAQKSEIQANTPFYMTSL